MVIFIVIPIVIIVIYISSLLFPELAQSMGGISNISSFLIVLLTYIYVVITGLMVRQMIQSQKDERRPYIIADLKLFELDLYIVLENTGKLPAKELSVKFEPDVPTLFDKKLNDAYFSKSISFCPPGLFMRQMINSGHKLINDENPSEYKVVLSYIWDGQKTPTREEYIINFDSFRNRTRRVTKDFENLVEALEKTNEILEDISEKIK
jgi:hypothetical protein